ncbi:hypothetical protein B0H17DRAFT_947144 [Mycena rosella]|uniref:Uncharacterized protein n=1 Tax=Mycena rosella TaxID=1033263 RepID=A0AAD7D0V2_MYCRO|nr:hypothetical protein B0H17DRAFT_947144 [Mycena rosella]
MPPAPTLDSTLGALEVGAMFSTFLFGLVTIQAFTYFRNFGNDSWKIRFVFSTYLIFSTTELVHTVLVLVFIYGKTITFYGNIEKLAIVPPEVGISIALTALIGPSVQAFYAFRIYRLSGRLWIPVICWVLCGTRWVILMACSIAAFIQPDLVKFKLRFWGLVVSALALSSILDVLITTSTCYYLWNQRSSAFQR